jgi:hypothetical protein
MLREEQAAELLKRCESVTGKRLAQIRGNLQRAESRASAVWELLVIEETSRIGKVEYEPYEGGSPDILLHLPGGREIWIEVAYIYPRFWKQERLSDAMANWLIEEAKRRDISIFKVSCRFDGDMKNIAGPVRNLPGLHEKRKFINEPDVRNFFETIKKWPELNILIKHRLYSVELIYSPTAEGPYLSTGGGLVQEAPADIKEHAVYRVLKEKARQHKVKGPQLICVGSDQSPALSIMVSPGKPTFRDAVYTVFSETQSIADVIIVRIEDSFHASGASQRYAKGEIFVNSKANDPFFKTEISQLRQLNFNRWKYFFRIEKYEKTNNDAFKRVGGNINVKYGGAGVEIEIPSNILIDSLAGKTNVNKHYSVRENDPLLKCVNEGWVVKSCSLKEGNIEIGEAPKVVLRLEPPLEAVFWPKKMEKKEQANNGEKEACK